MAGAATPKAVITTDTHVEQSNSHITLEWEAKGGSEEPWLFELQQARSSEFSNPLVRYRGPDRASFIAGLDEGTYFYRVRTIDSERLNDPSEGSAGPWSEPVEVVVEFQSLALAYSLFGVGAVVFLATLILVVAGSIRARQEEAEEDRLPQQPSAR